MPFLHALASSISKSNSPLTSIFFMDKVCQVSSLFCLSRLPARVEALSSSPLTDPPALLSQPLYQTTFFQHFLIASTICSRFCPIRVKARPNQPSRWQPQAPRSTKTAPSPIISLASLSQTARMGLSSFRQPGESHLGRNAPSFHLRQRPSPTALC